MLLKAAIVGLVTTSSLLVSASYVSVQANHKIGIANLDGSDDYQFQFDVKSANSAGSLFLIDADNTLNVDVTGSNKVAIKQNCNGAVVTSSNLDVLAGGSSVKILFESLVDGGKLSVDIDGTSTVLKSGFCSMGQINEVYGGGSSPADAKIANPKLYVREAEVISKEVEYWSWAKKIVEEYVSTGSWSFTFRLRSIDNSKVIDNLTIMQIVIEENTTKGPRIEWVEGTYNLRIVQSDCNGGTYNSGIIETGWKTGDTYTVFASFDHTTEMLTITWGQSSETEEQLEAKQIVLKSGACPIGHIYEYAFAEITWAYSITMVKVWGEKVKVGKGICDGECGKKSDHSRIQYEEITTDWRWVFYISKLKVRSLEYVWAIIMYGEGDRKVEVGFEDSKYRLRITQTCINKDGSTRQIVSPPIDTNWKTDGMGHVRMDFNDADGKLVVYFDNIKKIVYETTDTCSVGKIDRIIPNDKGNGRPMGIKVLKELIVWTKWVVIEKENSFGSWEGEGVELDEEFDCDPGEELTRIVKKMWDGVEREDKYQAIYSAPGKTIKRLFRRNKHSLNGVDGFTLVGSLSKLVSNATISSSISNIETIDDGSMISFSFDKDVLTLPRFQWDLNIDSVTGQIGQSVYQWQLLFDKYDDVSCLRNPLKKTFGRCNKDGILATISGKNELPFNTNVHKAERCGRRPVRCDKCCNDNEESEDE